MVDQSIINTNAIIDSIRGIQTTILQTSNKHVPENKVARITGVGLLRIPEDFMIMKLEILQLRIRSLTNLDHHYKDLHPCIMMTLRIL